VPQHFYQLVVLAAIGPVAQDVLVGLLDGGDYNYYDKGGGVRVGVEGRVGYDEHDDGVDEEVEVGYAAELLDEVLGQEVDEGVFRRDYLVAGVGELVGAVVVCGACGVYENGAEFGVALAVIADARDFQEASEIVDGVDEGVEVGDETFVEFFY